MEIEEIRKVNLICLLEEGGRGYAKELADLIGCEPSYLSQIKTGKKNMGSTFARQLEEAQKISNGWMDSVHPERYSFKLRQTVTYLKGLKIGAEVVDSVREVVRDPCKTQSNFSGDFSVPVGRVPLISWVTAGSWEDPVDNYHVGDAEEWLPCPSNCKKETTFALTVTGDSMDDGGSSGYRDGEMIFVDGSKKGLLHNTDVIVKNGEGKVTFKRLIFSNGDWFLKPLNPNWPDKMISLDGESELIGWVMFSGRMRK